MLKSAFKWLVGFAFLSPICAYAIPPNTPIGNTAVVDYEVTGTPYQVSDTAVVVTDAGSGNSAPSGVVLDPNNVDENASGAVVGDLTVQDSDIGDTHTLTVADARFEIIGLQLKLVDGMALDFETEPTVIVDVTATDVAGASVTIAVTVIVNDVNEAPTAVNLSNLSVAPDVPGAVVGTITVVDPDVGDIHVLTVDDPRFEIVNGELRLTSGASLSTGEIATVVVTATDSGGLSYGQTFDVTGSAAGATAATIEFLQFAPATGIATTLGASQCGLADGTFENVAATALDSSTLDVPGTHQLLGTVHYKAREPVFVRVMDADANRYALTADWVDINLTSGAEAEVIRAFETGVDTGEFIGVINSMGGPSGTGDCTIGTAVGGALTATYTDPTDGADVVQISVLVDPLGLVFESGSGTPIDGAAITLIDADTGVAAAVYGDDPYAPFPATIESGGSASDQAGIVYDFGPGEYRFPFVEPGSYVLLVSAPNRFAFPTAALDADLQMLPGAPYSLGPGSRGGVFVVPVGPAVRVDIPLDLRPLVPSDASIELMRADIRGELGGELEYVPATACAGAPLPAPVAADGSVLATNAQLLLAPASQFSRGEAVFVRLVDPDQDRDPYGSDTVAVVLTTAGGDAETIELSETGTSTGVFVGYLPTSQQTAQCALDGPQGTTFDAAYVDAFDNDDSVSADGVLDPGFTVFSSATGDRLADAEITLIDTATGEPALVLGADGVSAFPARLTSGGSATDTSGREYVFAPGSVFYPVIPPGTYRVDVRPPLGFEFPSVVADAAIQTLPGAPFAMSLGSRGEPFDVVAGTPAMFDIPLDRLTAAMFVAKRTNTDTVSVGDFVQYQVSIENPAIEGRRASVTLVDRLPVGFRYVSGSATIDNASAPDPSITPDARSLTFAVPGIGGGETADLRYVAEVTSGAGLGSAVNEAFVPDGLSNVASAAVMVREDLLTSRATILGQVLEGNCDGEEIGFPGVRVFLEDGTFAVTDDAGKFHFEGVTPGTHVVQLDVAYLPVSHEVVACERNTRFGSTAFSQFVDVSAGSLWRTKFVVREKAALTSRVQTRLVSRTTDTDRIRYDLLVSGEGEGLAVSRLSAVVVLPEGARYLPGSSFLDKVAVDDPADWQNGSLTSRLGDHVGHFAHRYRFEIDPQALNSVVVKAMVLFDSDDGKQRSPVVTNTLDLEAAPNPNEIGNAPTAGGHERGSDNPVRVRASNAAGFGDRRSGLQVATGVYTPSMGRLTADSGIGVVEVKRGWDSPPADPVDIPELPDASTPEFDRAWMASQEATREIVWPRDAYNPRIPSIGTVIKHKPGERVHVLVNGQLVNPLTFESTVSDRRRGIAVSRWKNLQVVEGDNVIRVEINDANDAPVASLERRVHYASEPVRAELVTERSYLVADGITPPVVAVRFFDREGHLARPGVSGEFTVAYPHLAYNEARANNPLFHESQQGLNRYLIVRDGIAYIRLEPTTDTSEVQLGFRFDEHRNELVRTRLEPAAREWILVGFGEGTLGYNHLTGNMENAAAAGIEDDMVTDGRVALYAKGRITGDWLMTLAYDTDHEAEGLGRRIDPNRFYTLYGDGGQQRYDAQSQRKLYLRLERREAQILLGDFETGLDDMEFTQYSRTLNGAKAEYFGDRVQAVAFASETDQGFVRDSVRGDGTSGIYRLSRGRIVRNSERIALVTRDRFKTEVVLERVPLARYTDYSIDYDAGTLIFKQPVFSQDAGFNPIFIESQYEVLTGADDVVAGGRVGVRFGEQDSEVGVTFVSEGEAGDSSQLLGVDLDWHASLSNRVIAEVGATDTQNAGRANAYRVELEHQSEDLAGRVYVREQESGYGLGQQVALESGTRKIGLEGERRLTDDLKATAEVYDQSVDNGGDRQVAEALAEYRRGDVSVRGGLRSAREQLHSVAGDETSRRADQLTVGASRAFNGGRLTLRADGEFAVGGGGSGDFADRAVLGADYLVGSGVSVLTEQEFTSGELGETQDTRVGLRAEPWTGGNASSMVQRRVSENGDRLFATTGLSQQWRVDETWLFDAGFDRVNTLSARGEVLDPSAVTFNPAVPRTSGSVNDDFTATYLGAGYRGDLWDITSRIEFHMGDVSDKWNLLAGANHQLAEGKIVAMSLALLDEELAQGGIHTSADARVGLAWRPVNARWVFLNRLDLVFSEDVADGFDTRARKLVNNLNVNFRPNDRNQLSLQLGAKYVVDQIDDVHYDGVTGLFGFEYRRDLSESWDIGLRGATLRSFASHVGKRSYGLSVGHNPWRDLWITLGYNVEGFDDRDFVAADYTAQGPYLKLRLKLDQSVLRRFLDHAGPEPVDRVPVVGRAAAPL